LEFIAKKCPSLRSLDLIGCKYISDGGLLALQKHSKELRTLTMSEASLTVAGLQTFLKNSEAIQSVAFTNCGLDIKALPKLRAEFKKIKITIREKGKVEQQAEKEKEDSKAQQPDGNLEDKWYYTTI
jgi:hypothetical protein